MEEKYLIGVEHLDAQHRTLFVALSRLRDILDEGDFPRKQRACAEGLHFLEQHVLRHFADEEAYMRSIGYTRYGPHKMQHEAITKTFIQCRDEIIASNYSIREIRRLLGTMLSWLAYHTNEIDSGIGKDAPQVDLVNDAAVALEKTVLQVIPDLFQMTPELADGNYLGDYYGNELFCLVDFDYPDGRCFRMLAALNQHVILEAMNTLLSITDASPTDELVLSAISELMAMLTVHFALNYQGGIAVSVKRTVTLAPAEVAGETPDGPPLCSLLFEQPHGSVLLRLWQLSDAQLTLLFN